MYATRTDAIKAAVDMAHHEFTKLKGIFRRRPVTERETYARSLNGKLLVSVPMLAPLELHDEDLQKLHQHLQADPTIKQLESEMGIQVRVGNALHRLHRGQSLPKPFIQILSNAR